jgi:hypothetical protein
LREIVGSIKSHESQYLFDEWGQFLTDFGGRPKCQCKKDQRDQPAQSFLNFFKPHTPPIPTNKKKHLQNEWLTAKHPMRPRSPKESSSTVRPKNRMGSAM